MGRPRDPQNPPGASCGATETVNKGREDGHQRWRYLAGGRSFGQTFGTPLYHLKTDVAEIVRALQVVLLRGSLRAAEDQTGHNYETTAAWLKRIGDHAAAMTDLLAHDLHLSQVELDELWSFVGQKGGHQTSVGQSDPCSAEGSGERWGCMSIDRASRLVVAWASGPREETLTETVVTTIRATYRDRDPLGIRMTQAVKHRKGRRLERLEVRATIDNPVDQTLSSPYRAVQRGDGTSLRPAVPRLWRLASSTKSGRGPTS